ncbi:carbohydrate ABC transporter permease [Streptomyces reniochalinae]|uniref:carbohydrate ABC transporter permease n=1 Tax=Streptomyces reniochalinae TaxID=2250578 RepID=UPI001FE4F587|nr:carbohydrate ABC transporter permease [Streptomyces reniochalinae]
MRRGGAGVTGAAAGRWTGRTERWSGYVLLTAGAVAVVVPFLSVFLASMQPSGEPVVGMEWPERWSLDNYRQAWTVAGFSSLMRSSALIAVGVVPASLVLAGLAGYALGTMRLPGGDGVAALFVAGLTIPVELIVVPLYFDLRNIGLTDSYLGVVLVEIALFLPFGVFWMRTHFRATPPQLVEAARIDGASSWTVLFRVLLPLARPALTTLGVLVFMWSWNQFLLVLVLIQDATKRTAPAGLGFFVGQNNTDVPMLAAGTILVMLPITIVYVLFQRSFVAGLLQGAFKG